MANNSMQRTALRAAAAVQTLDGHCQVPAVGLEQPQQAAEALRTYAFASNARRLGIYTNG
jgi:hypothetical protein